MHIVIGLALGLIVVGLIMIIGSRYVDRPPLLGTVVLWCGIVLLIVGLVLLLTPPLNWLNGQLRQMLGA